MHKQSTLLFIVAVTAWLRTAIAKTGLSADVVIPFTKLYFTKYSFLQETSMSKPLSPTVHEDLKELQSLMRSSIMMLKPRVIMLILLKKHGSISRRKLAVMLGVSDRSVQTWRQTYIEGGIEALIRHDRKGPASRIFGEAERKFLEETLNDPRNGIQGYTELRKIMNERFGKDFDYVTLREYCKRHFGAKIKVARKSHVKKDESAVSA